MVPTAATPSSQRPRPSDPQKRRERLQGLPEGQGVLLALETPEDLLGVVCPLVLDHQVL